MVRDRGFLDPEKLSLPNIDLAVADLRCGLVSLGCREELMFILEVLAAYRARLRVHLVGPEMTQAGLAARIAKTKRWGL